MGRIHNWISQYKFRMKLREMDEVYFLHGDSCFGLFPPSFYYTHSPEEVKRIKEECLAELRRMIEEFDNDQQEQSDYRQNIVQENKGPWLNIIHSMYNKKY